MTLACVPTGCRQLWYPNWYQVYSSKGAATNRQLPWVGWLYTDGDGIDIMDNDYDAPVAPFTQAGYQMQSFDYRRHNYPFGPRYSDQSFEGAKQWFRVAREPFALQASFTRNWEPIGWLWSTPYKVKRFLVNQGDYVVFYADGREISFMEAIH